MKVLVDTSVWVAHLRQRDEQLAWLLAAGRVICHPYVVIEVACSTPPRREEVVQLLRALEQAPLATHDELLALIRARSLSGRGCGLVDLGLLASALLGEHIRLWSLDRRLALLADECGRAYRPPLAA
jgi:predicted nucleic acid-binding protein